MLDQDISYERALHDLLYGNSELLAGIDAITPYPIQILNPDLSIKYANSAFEKLTGFSAKDLVGVRPPYPYWPKGQKRKNLLGIKNALSQGGTKVDWEFRRKNGKRFWVEITDKPLIVNGEVIFSISQWVDITQRKQLEYKLKKNYKDLRALSAHVVALIEEERSRISRAIHDELGQDLTAFIIDLCWVQRNLHKDKNLLFEKLDSMVKQVEITLQTAKRLYTELRPTILDDLGLAAAIKWQVSEFQKSTGLKCHLKINLENVNIQQNISTVFFRILQQILFNVYRHAYATRIRIALYHQNNRIFFNVRDNGRGITQEEIDDPKSFGLMGIRERVNYLGGIFKISGVPKKGTEINIIVPFRNGRTET